MFDDNTAVQQGTDEQRTLVVVRRQAMLGPDRNQIQRASTRSIFLQVEQAADRSIAEGILFRRIAQPTNPKSFLRDAERVHAYLWVA